MTAPGGAGDELPGNGKRRRVLMIPAYASNPYCHLLASALRDRGWEVTTCGIGGWLPLFRAVRSHGRPDLVHLQWQHRFFLKEDEKLPSAAARTLLFFLQWLALRLTGVRFVWTVHNLVNHERQLVRLELAACRLLARLVEGIVVHCRTASERVSAVYAVSEDRITVVPHGHYIGWYPEPPERAEARRRLGLPEEATVVLHFGQIRPYKGVEELIRAFSSLDPEEMRLVILGQPRYESLGEELRTLAAGDPRIRAELRFASEEELVTYLTACDVVALPYRHSLTSGSAILAASVGRPVLAPDVGCLRDFPDHAKIAYSGEGAGHEGLLAALRRAGEAPLEPMGSTARRFIERFPWQRVAAATCNLYRDIR